MGQPTAGGFWLRRGGILNEGMATLEFDLGVTIPNNIIAAYLYWHGPTLGATPSPSALTAANLEGFPLTASKVWDSS